MATLFRAWVLLGAAAGAAVTSSAKAQSEAGPTAAELRQQLAVMEQRLRAQEIAEAHAAVTEAQAAMERARVACLELQRLNALSGDAAVPCGRAAQMASGQGQVGAGDVPSGPTAASAPGQPGATAQNGGRPSFSDDDDGKYKFGGIEFGIGIAFSTDVGETDRIKDAQLVDGVVRVTDSDNTKARLMLETHYFFTPTFVNRVNELLGMKNYPDDVDRYGNITKAGVKNWGIGPFVALQPGEDELIDAVGAGLMVGLRRPGEGSDSFNIGVGLLVDLNVRTLGRDIVEDEPLPGEETEIRFRDESQAGIMVMSSYSF